MKCEQQIRAILERQGDFWVAQCLEFDIGAQGTSLDEVKTRLEAVLKLELQESISRTGAPFDGIPMAPVEFVSRWGAIQDGSEKGGPILAEDAKIEVSYFLAA